MAADPEAEVAPDLPEHFSVTLAGLSDEGQEEVLQGLEEGEVDAQTLLQNAEAADVNREDIEILRQEQADAAEAGDFDKAGEFALKAEYEMREVEELGGDMDEQILEAEYDQMDLDNADHDQEIAVDNAQTAESYAEIGDVDHAAQYADVAADHADSAAEYGAQGDAGGHYGDHDASSTVDE